MDCNLLDQGGGGKPPLRGKANLPRLSCRERQPLHDSDSRKVASRPAHPLLGVQQLWQKLRSLLPDRVEDDVAEEREHVPDDLLVLVKLLHLLMEGGQDRKSVV